MVMDDIVRETFRSLGYNVDLVGANMYFDIIYEVIDGVKNGLSNEALREMIPAYCLELYHFCYEVGKIRFFDFINEFLNSKKKIRKKKQTISVNGISREDLGFDNQLIYYAKYFIRKERELKPNMEYVKR